MKQGNNKSESFFSSAALLLVPISLVKYLEWPKPIASRECILKNAMTSDYPSQAELNQATQSYTISTPIVVVNSDVFIIF